MKPTITKNRENLTSSEICQIIEASAKNNVVQLKYGSLYLNFCRKEETTPKNPDTEISDQQQTQSARDSFEQQELDLKAERIAMALIEDPALAEQMMADEDLENADDESSDE